MADPGTDPAPAASFQSAPLPPQAEAAATAGIASPPVQSQTAAQTAAGEPQPQPQTGTGEVVPAGQPPAQSRAPSSQERVAAADAEKQPPPPPASRARSEKRIAAADAAKLPPAPPPPPPRPASRAPSEKRVAAVDAAKKTPAPPPPPPRPASRAPSEKRVATADAGKQPPPPPPRPSSQAPSEKRVAAADAGKQPQPPPPRPASRAPSEKRVATADAGKQPPPPPPRPASRAPSEKRYAAADAEKQPPPPPPPPPQVTRSPLEKKVFAADAGKQPPAPPPPPPPPVSRASSEKSVAAAADVEKKSAAPAAPPPPPSPQDEKGAAVTKLHCPHISRWPRLRAAVLWLTSLIRLQRGHELPARLTTPARGGYLRKNFGKAARFVRMAVRLSCRGRSPSKNEPAPAKKAVDDDSKGPPAEAAQEAGSHSKEDDDAQAKEKMEKEKPQPPHPCWGKVETQLEKILEESCVSMLAADFNGLDDKTRRCLLTFSVFKLDSEVKKQAVTYWWAAQRDLLSESPQPSPPGSEKDGGAERLFAWFAGNGFLEPIRNPCSRVIHGCRVNPLVHWMVKLRAREEFADLDGAGDPSSGDPSSGQVKSDVLCLTAGNRAWLQGLPMDDEGQGRGKRTLWPRRQNSTTAAAPTAEEKKDSAQLEQLHKKKAVLNISAHVYRLPEPLLSKLAGDLEVLQLGRWWNSDDETYLEVESLRAVGKLRNLRYLSLRGLSGPGLTELPEELGASGALSQLAVLDMRGCQKLVRVSSKAIANLRSLTTLDLTECYMLEHVGRGVVSLPELLVLKGFVFAVGSAAARRNACRLGDLVELKKLRKLSVNVTTDAHVGNNEMKALKELTSLQSLTVTWGEIPSILLDSTSKRKSDLTKLLNRWTNLELPQNLKKLDLRCYPVRPQLDDAKDDDGAAALPWGLLEQGKKLAKLYVRGGDVKTLDIQGDMPTVTTLRLRFLKRFAMAWEDLKKKLPAVRCMEVVMKDPKVKIEKGREDKPKDGEKGKLTEHTRKARLERQKKEKEEESKLMAETKKRMNIPDSALDEDGVWVLDDKELLKQYEKSVPEPPEKAGKDGGINGGDDPTKAQATPSNFDDQNKGNASVPEPSEKAEKGSGSEGDNSSKAQTTLSRPDDQNKEGKVEGQGGAEPAEERSAKEDGQETSDSKPEVAAAGDGKVKKADGGGGGAAGEAQTGDEEGRADEEEDEEPAEGSGGDDDTSPAVDAATTPAAQPPELPRQESADPATDHDEEAVAPAGAPAADAGGAPGTALLPAPSATTEAPAPAAAGEATAQPKEPAAAGKADEDDGSTATNTGA